MSTIQTNADGCMDTSYNDEYTVMYELSMIQSPNTTDKTIPLEYCGDGRISLLSLKTAMLTLGMVSISENNKTFYGTATTPHNSKPVIPKSPLMNSISTVSEELYKVEDGNYAYLPVGNLMHYIDYANMCCEQPLFRISALYNVRRNSDCDVYSMSNALLRIRDKYHDINALTGFLGVTYIHDGEHTVLNMARITSLVSAKSVYVNGVQNAYALDNKVISCNTRGSIDFVTWHNKIRKLNEDIRLTDIILQMGRVNVFDIDDVLCANVYVVDLDTWLDYLSFNRGSGCIVFDIM